MASNTEVKLPEIQVESEKRDRSSSSGNASGCDSDDDKSKTKYKLFPRPRHERRDSGSSIGEEDEIKELTEELREKIILQAEFYFSDENLKRDGFLLKHVKRNKEGYVNLKLLASFKKMKSLSRDYKIIGEALQNSTKLVVNDTGLKLRRVEPLPKELIDQVKVKHLVVSKIPHENPSMNFIIDSFPKHKDDVVSVRIVKPGKKFPNDLQSHFSRHPELRDEIVAVVEFENPEVTTEASKTLFSENYKGLQIKLLELGPKQSKKKENGEIASDTPVDSDASVTSNKKSKNKSNSRLLEVSGRDDAYSSYASSSDSEFSSFNSCSKRFSRSRGTSPATSPNMYRKLNGSNNNSKNNSRNNSAVTSPNPSPKFQRKNPSTPENTNSHNSHHKLSPLVRNSPMSSPEVQRKSKVTERNSSVGNVSPWMLRKMQMGNMNATTETIRAGHHKHLDIVRQPIGPDGSQGFSNHPLKKFILVHAC